MWSKGKGNRNKGQMYILKSSVWVAMPVFAQIAPFSCVCCGCESLFVALVMRAFKTWISLYRRPLTRKYWIRISVLFVLFIEIILSLSTHTQQMKISIVLLSCVFFSGFLFPVCYIIIFRVHSFAVRSKHPYPYRNALQFQHFHFLLFLFLSYSSNISRELFLFTDILQFCQLLFFTSMWHRINKTHSHTPRFIQRWSLCTLSFYQTYRFIRSLNGSVI